MTAYMLDTNTVSHIIRNDNPKISARLSAVAADHDVVISAVTEAEMFYGLAKRTHSKRLSVLIEDFLTRVEVWPWGEDAARFYGDFRYGRETSGVNLEAHDMLIAAHAASTSAVLVSRDKAFRHLSPHLLHEDWSA